MAEPDQYWSAWRKSSYSGGNGGQCVEAGAEADVEAGAAERIIAVRDSKNPAGPKLLFTSHGWHQFTASLKAGAFDLPS